MFYLSSLNHRAERFSSEELNVCSALAVLEPDVFSMEESEESERLGNRTLDLDHAVVLILDLKNQIKKTLN